MARTFRRIRIKHPIVTNSIDDIRYYKIFQSNITVVVAFVVVFLFFFFFFFSSGQKSRYTVSEENNDSIHSKQKKSEDNKIIDIKRLCLRLNVLPWNVSIW